MKRQITNADVPVISEAMEHLAQALKVVGIIELKINNVERKIFWDGSKGGEISPEALKVFADNMNDLLYKVNGCHD